MEKRTKFWIFSGIIILACGAWLNSGHRSINVSAAREEPSENDKDRISVVGTPVRMMDFENAVKTYGNVESKNFALVSARIPGVIDDIYVEEGDRVVKGKTDLFQTDKIKVTQAVEIARHDVSVAEFSYRAKKATVARVEADFEKAHIDYERFKRLYENDGAVTKNALESQESRFKQVKASLEEAEAGADLAQRRLEQARSNLVIANKDLKDSLVKAPITGYVSKRYREPGEMAGAGTPVLKIDNLSVLEISAFIPDQHYTGITAGKTSMRVNVRGTGVGELPVTYKSPTIDNRLRNFEVKALLDDPPEGIAPGAMANISVVLERYEALGVPRDAVLTRTSGKVVFLAREGKAKMLQVKTGLETNGNIEVISGELDEGSSVITMGQDQLNDGSLISVLREEQG